MNWLTLNEIKKQCVIDDEFKDDDKYLEMLGDSAEDTVKSLVNKDLYELAAVNGGVLPAPVRHAMRMLVDYFYAIERGSADGEKAIPESVFLLLKLYRHFD